MKTPRVHRAFQRLFVKAGAPPGTIVHVGEHREAKIHLSLTQYNPENYTQTEIQSIEEILKLNSPEKVDWINVDGLHDVEIISRIGEYFKLHSLVLEDVANTTQRPKMEEYDGYLFIVLKMLQYNETTQSMDQEQVSLVLTNASLVSFQEKEGDVFGMIRERLKSGKGRVRNDGADYLAYAIIDAIVDHYFVVLEKLGDEIVVLEDQMMSNPSNELLRRVHTIKNEVVGLRRAIWPLREVINGLLRTDSELISKSTRVFLRDVYDHSIQVIDTVESYRDVISGMMDLYLSSMSHKMNEVMKVLTIIATIFIPLTFVAGVYGMNFQYMPELAWHYGYFGVLALMIIIGVGMFVFFRTRKWL